MKKILFALLALASLVGLGIVGAPAASADPGHVTLSCGAYTSTHWVPINEDGIQRGRVCMTLHSDGDHVDITYWSTDDACDGIDIIPDRNLSWVDDGWVGVSGPTGCGTTAHSNKMYDIGTSLRWAQLRGWTDPGYTTATTSKLYW